MIGIALKNKRISLMLCSILVLTVTGCGSQTQKAGDSKEPQTTQPTAPVQSVPSQSASSQPFLTFKDMAGREIVLTKKPERIVILATETLDLFYQLGGKAVGRASASGHPVSDAQKEAQDVGQVDKASLEQIAALKPDLVIGSYYFNATLKDTFAASNIPFALVKITNYEDLQQVGKLYGQILGKPSEAGKSLQDMDARIQAIVNKLPQRTVTFAQITIMPMGAYITKGSSMTVDMARRLKLKNVADGMTGGEIPDYVPYSLEKLLQADPEYLFMVVHGTEEFGKKKLKDDMESNPAWASLRAVKEKKLIFLPDKAEKTPGLDLDFAFENLAKLVHPDIFR